MENSLLFWIRILQGCEEAIQLAYGTWFFRDAQINARRVTRGLLPPVKLESSNITLIVLGRRKSQQNITVGQRYILTSSDEDSQEYHK